MIEIAITLLLLFSGLVIGTVLERRHYSSIQTREAMHVKLAVLTEGKVQFDQPIAEAALVTGSAVIAMDYFKWFAGWVKSLYGGRIGAYETLVDRARREAVLRMKEQASGFDLVINARLETCSIGGATGGRASIPSVEVLAYGTAIRFHQDR